jgi:hypothetical protein
VGREGEHVVLRLLEARPLHIGTVPRADREHLSVRRLAVPLLDVGVEDATRDSYFWQRPSIPGHGYG